MNEPGLTLSRQAPVDADATIALDDAPPSDVWASLADTEAFQTALVGAVLDAATGRTYTEFLDTLDDVGVDGAYASLVARTARGDRRAVFDLLRETRRLATGHSSTDDILAAARLFQLSDTATPTVAVVVNTAFREQRADQRRTVCRLLAALAGGCAVRVYGSGLTLSFLQRTHREDLPSVDEWCSTPHTGGPLADVVATARDELADESPYLTTLREIADRDSETASYASLKRELALPSGTVRSHAKRLGDLELVEPFDGCDGRTLELTPVGRELVETLDSEIGRQRSLSESVEKNSKSKDDSRVHATAHGETPPDSAATATADRDRVRLPQRHDLGTLHPDKHALTVATAPKHGVGVVNYPIDPKNDRAEAGWYYDSSRDELTVSAEATGVLSWRVCTARALASPKTWRDVLDEDRLEDRLGDLVREHKELLRGARNLGFLPEKYDDVTEFRDAIQEALDDLLTMTGRLSRGEYPDQMDESDYRGLVCREALGLSTLMMHVLDLCGVDVHIRMRLPNYTRDFDSERRDSDVLKTLATETALYSKHGQHVAYRLLYEQREDKRQQAFDPTIDAEHPFGTLIPSYSIVGDFGNRTETFATALEEALSSPAELHEDAPEFAVRVPVRTTHDHDAVDEVVRRVLLDRKNLYPTHEAVNVLTAFARTPYDVVDALRALSREASRRKVRLDEVRYALATLNAKRLLDDASPTVRKAITALLRADEPLSRDDLVDRAGIALSSWYNHRDVFAALELVKETPDGFRLFLPTYEDRHEARGRLPQYVTDDSVLARDVVYEALLATDAPIEVFEVWTDLPPDGVPDVDRLVDDVGWLAWALPLLRGLSGEERPTDAREVRFGAEVEQTSLQATTDGAGGVAG